MGDSGVVGFLLVAAFLEDGADGIGLGTHVFIAGEDGQGFFILRQGFLVFALGVKGIASVEVGVENLLTFAVLLDLHQRLVEFLFGFGIVGTLLECHLVIGLGTDIIVGGELGVAALHQRLITLGGLRLKPS